MSLYCSVTKNASTAEMTLQGEWNVTSLLEIEKNVRKQLPQNIKSLTIDAGGLKYLDTSAAWFLHHLMTELEGLGVKVKLLSLANNYKLLFERVAKLDHEEKAEEEKPSSPQAYITAIGRHSLEMLRDTYTGISFLGEFFAGIPLGFLGVKKFRLRSIIFHVNEVGIKAAPIIALMAFSVAFVTGYQGAFQLQKFDATVYTVDLIALSTLREMGVLITAIMLAGRSGSAFAAQIGTMKLNEEVDALKTMGVSHFDVIVMPRIIAIIISLPLLTVIADFMGMLGGYVFSYTYLGYSYVQFLSRLQEAVDLQQFYIGLYKASVFAVLIGLAGCMQGLRATHSAEDVGRKTILAVVQSIFLVVVADALFSIIFTKLGI